MSRRALVVPVLAAAFGWLLTLPGAGSTARPIPGQGPGAPDTVPYRVPSSWQRAAIATLNRHLPTDSGYWALGPLDLEADLPDTLRLLRTTLRVVVPGPNAGRTVARRLWVPTGGLALEELQPADTLPYEPPAGYPGRFLKGTVAGQRVYVQVLTVQEHRWLLWAERVLLTEAEEGVGGPLERYSRAVSRYLASVDTGGSEAVAPSATDHDLAPTFDLFGEMPAPVIRDRSGYLSLFEGQAAFDLGSRVQGVYGVIPGPPLAGWLDAQKAEVLLRNRAGEPAIQRAYQAYLEGEGHWSGLPVLSPRALAALPPGRYAYAVDRYDFIRVGPLPEPEDTSAATVTPALLVHNDPVRIAGRLVLRRGPDGDIRVAEVDIRTEEYLFSNRSLSIYEDVEQRSDEYLRITAGHLLRAFEVAGIPREHTVIRKF